MRIPGTTFSDSDGPKIIFVVVAYAGEFDSYEEKNCIATYDKEKAEAYIVEEQRIMAAYKNFNDRYEADHPRQSYPPLMPNKFKTDAAKKKWQEKTKAWAEEAKARAEAYLEAENKFWAGIGKTKMINGRYRGDWDTKYRIDELQVI